MTNFFNLSLIGLLATNTVIAKSSTTTRGLRRVDAASDQRRLAFQTIVGYEPRTQVTDDAALDLDQSKMVELLGEGRVLNARTVYTAGGFSGNYATMTILNVNVGKNYTAGTQVVGSTQYETEVNGVLMEDVTFVDGVMGNYTIKVRYLTSDVQSTYVNCQVGNMFSFQGANRDGCFNTSGNLFLIPVGMELQSQGIGSFKYKYDVRKDNNNFQTLQLVSTQTNETMKNCPTCSFYDDFMVYYDYYGDTDYGDRWVLGASFASSTSYASGLGDANFTLLRSRSGEGQAMVMGSACLNIWMAVVRQMELAAYECAQGMPEAVHSLDKAVAFYAGSLEGETGSDYGVMLYALANWEARLFNTAGDQGNSDTGLAYVNNLILDQFKAMQQRLLGEPGDSQVVSDKCAAVASGKSTIVNYMKVPLIQGTLRYAYRNQYENATTLSLNVNIAAGATFAAAILPYVYKCNAADAKTIYDNLAIGASSTDFQAVKQALERNYHCLGVTCELIGGIWNGNDYSIGAEPCGYDASKDKNPNATSTLISSKSGNDSNNNNNSNNISNNNRGFGILILAIFAATVLGAFILRFQRSNNQKQREAGNNIAAVGEIS